MPILAFDIFSIFKFLVHMTFSIFMFWKWQLLLEISNNIEKFKEEIEKFIPNPMPQK